MSKELKDLKEKNWSLNLEDAYYEEHIEDLLLESQNAVRQTKSGYYVNIVTPAKCGDPRDWLVSQLSIRLKETEVSIQDIQYIDQCGCGGYVVRVFR
jgi:hypothetical protein